MIRKLISFPFPFNTQVTVVVFIVLHLFLWFSLFFNLDFVFMVQKIKILEAKSFPLPKSGAKLMICETIIEPVKYYDALMWEMFLVCFIQSFFCKKFIKLS